MTTKIIKKIVIKKYQEFTEEVSVEDIGTVGVHIIAKEVEAVVEVDDGTIFSLGFSVLRDNAAFQFESPRNIVQDFLIRNLKFDIQE